MKQYSSSKLPVHVSYLFDPPEGKAILQLTAEQKHDYQRNGYLLLRNPAPEKLLEDLEKKFLYLVDLWGGGKFTSAQDPKLAQALLSDRGLETKLYDGIRKFPWLVEFASAPQIADLAADLLNRPVGVLSKIPFRIDLPEVIRELAVWHQDYRYVKGNSNIITAWIPLQDTPFIRGSLMVMPGSHQLGVLDHDQVVLGKRHLPSSVFDREVRYIEMAKGDVLLFHSLLLHSSSLNLSSTARLTVQARYAGLGTPTDAGMGELIPIHVAEPSR